MTSATSGHELTAGTRLAAPFQRSGQGFGALWWVLFTLVMLLFSSGPVKAQDIASIPAFNHWVTDETQTLTSAQQQSLDDALARFNQRKGSQLAVLMVPSTQPEAIEQYSIRAVEKWKLGRKGVDDGVLLLVSKNDHRMRIEVGYGLEGALPDAIANRIIDEYIAPAFRQGDYNKGITQGVQRITQVINGESLPPPQHHSSQHSDSTEKVAAYLIPFFVVGMWLSASLGRLVSSLVVGAGVAALSWFLGVGLLFAVGLGAIGALAIFFIAPLLSSLGGGGGGPGGFGGGGFGGFGGGGFGGFGGGGSGGGGFGGGGGGSFGGGGASGGW